jgi:hypothetical protein
VPYTTTDFITDVKLRCFAPTSQITFTESDILLLADAEMQTTILPLVQSLREDYLVTYKDTTIVADQANYELPDRGVGLQLREVHIIDGDNGTVFDVPQIDTEQVQTTQSGDVQSFYIRGNELFLYRAPSSVWAGKTLRLYYFLRPSKFVLTTAAAQVATITQASDTVTVSSVPSSWTTSNTFDFVRQKGGSETLGIDYEASAVGTTIVFTSDMPSRLAVGDYVALAGETPLIQLPPELRPVLAQATACQMLSNMKLPGADDGMKRLETEIKAATVLLTPRVHGETKKIIARHGWL